MQAHPDRARIGIGIVGLGRAATISLPALLGHPRARVVGVTDLDPVRAKELATELDVSPFPTLRQMCASPEVDTVYVATPHQCHAEDAITAATHGKHVIVEKPMALRTEDCARMTEAAASAGVHLVVGPTHAFDRPIGKLRELVHGGRYGPLRRILTFNYTDFLYRPRRPEELDTARGGGVLFNQLPHQVDLVREIALGRVISVQAATEAWDPARPTEGMVSGWLRFDDGAVAITHYSGYAHFDSDEFHELVGELGAVKPAAGFGGSQRRLRGLSAEDEATLKHASATTAWRSRPRQQYHEHFGVVLVSCEQADLRAMPTGVTVHDEDGRTDIPVAVDGGARAALLDELSAAVLDGVAPRHDGRWGEATMSVCLAIARSAECGGLVCP